MASGAGLVAGIIDRIEGRRYGTGRPPLPTIRVVGTLRSFVRGGVRWRGPRAAADRVRGSTLRRRPEGRGATALPRRVHVALVRVVRAGPEGAPRDVVVDSRSVRAKFAGGELTGAEPPTAVGGGTSTTSGRSDRRPAEPGVDVLLGRSTAHDRGPVDPLTGCAARGTCGGAVGGAAPTRATTARRPRRSARGSAPGPAPRQPPPGSLCGPRSPSSRQLDAAGRCWPCRAAR